MEDSHIGIRNSVLKWLRPYTELMWFYCNDNVAKRDFESQTAYSQFAMDIVIRSGIIYQNDQISNVRVWMLPYYDFEQTVKGPVIGT